MSGYFVAFGDHLGDPAHVVVAGRRFLLKEEALCVGLRCDLPSRVRDLVRTGMAIYVVDRLWRRNRRSAAKGPSRDVELAVEVSDPDFWRSRPVTMALRRACELLSGDRWDISFSQPDHRQRCRQRFLNFPVPDNPMVCLYSGGLDSAAGLATQLRNRRARTVVVTADHQRGLGSTVRKQLAWLRRRYGRELHPVIVRTELLKPPRPAQQELTQRCRSLLFAALGGAAACASRASTVEVYENGVGAINLPLMAGMQVGGRSSRSSHPAFLRHMTDLVSLVAERPVSFELPFRDQTKAELVRSLREDGLERLARDTVSCAHYPLRERGPAKQCGVCAACIGRRQALITAGIEEPAERYLYDLFADPAALAAVPSEKLDFLRATIMQLTVLSDLGTAAPLPGLVRRQIFGTGIARNGESVEDWTGVLVRYREEWLKLLTRARSRGLHWGNWLRPRGTAA